VGEMWVVWDAPSSNGGAPILGYEVTSLTGVTCNTVGRDPIVLEFDPIDEACRMGFIGEGTHSFTVVAINALGSGPSSVASFPVDTISHPGAPRNLEGFSEDGQAKVTWWAPSDDCCTPITGFTVTASPGGATCTAPSGSTDECTVTGLTNGVSYTLTVVANGDSWVSDAASVVVVPGTPSVPGAVTNFEFTSGETGSDGTVWAYCLSIDAPTDNGGSAVTGYYLNQVIDGVSQNNNWVIYQEGGQCSTGSSYGNVGQTLRYSIAAFNAAGTGPTVLSDEVTLVAGS